MYLSFVPLALIPLFLSTVLCTRFDWSVKNGKTRLRGNSFGIGYVNATYDYIVSFQGRWEANSEPRMTYLSSSLTF